MARKRYQKGQLWLEKDGWHGRWREDVIVNGVRQRPRRQGLIGTLKDYPTKRLAQRALDEHIEHVNKISYRPMPTAKFADFAQNWEAKVLSQYGDSTAINYRTHIRKHLVPFFGEYSMKDVNPEMIQQFVSASAVSAKTTKNICITLQSMWTTAKAWGYVAHDIMDGVVLPEVKRVQRFFFSQREIQLILAKAQEPQRTWYGLAAETGLRAGELCGLTVDDIDIERGMLQVRQSAWRGKLGDPKTDDSTRVVELSPQACAHLRTFLKSWHPNQRRLLFATRNGTPWDQNLLLKRNFGPLVRPLGIQVPAAMASTLPSWECNSDEQFRSIAEIASTETRSRGRIAGHGDNLHSCDQRGWKADRGAARQGSLGNPGPQLDPKGKRLRSGVP